MLDVVIFQLLQIDEGLEEGQNTPSGPPCFQDGRD